MQWIQKSITRLGQWLISHLYNGSPFASLFGGQSTKHGSGLYPFTKSVLFIVYCIRLAVPTMLKSIFKWIKFSFYTSNNVIVQWVQVLNYDYISLTAIDVQFKCWNTWRWNIPFLIVIGFESLVSEFFWCHVAIRG